MSARSASTRILSCIFEAHIVLLLFSFPQSAVGHRSRARSAQAKLSLRVANLSRVLRDCCCRCAQSQKGVQHLEVSKGCCKECAQESFLRLRVIRKLRKDKAFETIEGQRREDVP